MKAGTPGPWRWRVVDRRYEVYPEKDLGECVARIPRWSDDVDRADALLIAAAPDLYNALRELARACDLPVSERLADALAAVDVAISKAEGR